MLFDVFELPFIGRNQSIESLDLPLDARLLRAEKVKLALQHCELRVERFLFACYHFRKISFLRGIARGRRRERVHAVALRFDTRPAHEQRPLLDAQLTHALVGQKDIGNGCGLLGQSEPAGSSHDTFYSALVAKGIDTRYPHVAEYI